ncbi:MAG: alkaline phosphatase [Planctomycetota bacterium]|nr:alkaline phosphatase [Planctomycetota bacterium]
MKHAHHSSTISRRGFLSASATAGLLWSPALAGCGSLEIRDEAADEARNVIFLVADGMNTGTWTLADYYLQHQTKQRTEWVQLYQERAVTRALMETCSANSRVTDSAAAASAWSTGVRIDNGAINFAPDGSELTPIHRRVQQSGRSTGLVTTTRVTHATPAAFAANVKIRGEEDTIARQYLEREVDVLLGGGEKNFSAQTRADGIDLKQQYEQAGYQILESREQLLNSGEEGAKRLLGLFWPSHLPYSIDRNQQPEIAQQVPTLAEMMRRALSTLEQNRHGFLLQVEGGRVDHGGHGNDVGAIVHDQLAFDECIAVAREYSQQHSDTLVIVTTDHGCGGCQLNGVGSGYRDTDQTFFSGVEAIGASYEYLQSVLPSMEADQFKALVQQRLQIEIDEPRQQQLVVAQATGGYAVANQLRSWHDSFARTGVNWTSGNHTGEFVELCAWGPGSAAIDPWIRNIDLQPVIGRALQLS